MSNVSDIFTAARKRIEAQVEYSIEIDAAAIPMEFEFTPSATFIERLHVTCSQADIAELLHTTLEESK